MIYETIKEIAKEKNMSINQLEAECDLPQGSICKWDKIAPSFKKMKRVTNKLGVTVDGLLEKSGITEKDLKDRRYRKRT